MTKPRIERVMVVGHGVMGRGILLTFARAGFDCVLMTRHPAKVQDAPKGVRITDAPPEDWQPDLVVESIVEAIEPKLDLFRRLDRRYAGSAILASNTSSLPLQRFTEELSRPDRVVGLHYFQPPETMEFVELTEVAETAGDVVESLREALARAGKQVLHLKKPVVGFLVNRLQHALAHEAYYLIEQGLVDAATIDLVMKRLLAPRMCVTGIMEQKDWSGLDTHALSQRALLPHLHHGAEPSAMVQKLHAEGHLGVKSGRGFYDWRDRDIPALRRANAEKLGRVLALLREFDTAEAG